MTNQLPSAFDNRVSRDLGVDIPIVQAPMGWIARSQLASAVSAAGACGIIETSSGELDAVKGEIAAMHELTDRPFGVNIAQAFVRDPSIAEFVIEQGVKFVTGRLLGVVLWQQFHGGRRSNKSALDDVLGGGGGAHFLGCLTLNGRDGRRLLGDRVS